MKRIFLQTIMAAAVFLSACNKNENPAGAGLPDGEEVKTINVTIREPESNTRVGVDVDDANKVDKYHWIDGDKIWLLEVNAAGDAFTGQRYEYTYVPTSSNVNGVFLGRGAVIGRNYVPVHIRKDVLMVWPAADDKYLKFNMSTFTQTGLWTDPGVQQAFVDQLLFVGVKFTMIRKPGSLIVLKHMLTQVEVALTAKYSYDEGYVLTNVVLNCSNNSYASNLSIGVLGTVDETTCTWGNQSSTTTLNNVPLSKNNAYQARVLLYQKKGTQVSGKVIAGNGESAPTTAKELSVGKVYKLKSPIQHHRTIRKPSRNMLATQKIINNGVHELKFDFKNSEYNKLQVRVKDEEVNTIYTKDGITNTRVDYLTPGGADGIELTWPISELTVRVPNNGAVNLLHKITVEYLDNDGSGNLVWKSDQSPTIYQDGVAFNGSVKQYMVRYENYPKDVSGNFNTLNEFYSDGIVTWLAAAKQQKTEVLNFDDAQNAVKMAKLTTTVGNINDIPTMVQKVVYSVIIYSRHWFRCPNTGTVLEMKYVHAHRKEGYDGEENVDLPQIDYQCDILIPKWNQGWNTWNKPVRSKCNACGVTQQVNLDVQGSRNSGLPVHDGHDEYAARVIDGKTFISRTVPAVRESVLLGTTGDVCAAEE